MKLVFCLEILLLVVNLYDAAPSDSDTLVALQLLIRHGNRTSQRIFEEYEQWYLRTFEPFEYGQITPCGRRQSLDLGNYLRERYNSFLPEEFFYSDVQVRCTGMQRILEAAAVVMAAMFPPKDKQMWQESGLGSIYTPIPCEHPLQSNDILLEPDSTDCPRFLHRLHSIEEVPEFETKYNALTKNGDVNKYAASMLNLTEPLNLQQMRMLFENLMAMDSNNVPLPYWSKTLYPEPLKSLEQLVFFTQYSDVEMIRFAAGELMNEILSTGSTFEQDPIPSSNRKVYAYVGHDSTLYPMLVGLGFEAYPPLVSFSAALIMELHRNKTTNEIGYKFLYRNETWSDPIVYTVPGCQEICPLSFLKIKLQPYIPTRPFFEYC